MAPHIAGSIVLIVLGVYADGAAGADAEIPMRKFSDCSGCPRMVRLPAGQFLMGTAEKNPDSDSGEGSDEQPQHSVTFDRSFAIGQYAVTRREFSVFVRDTGHDPTGCFTPKGQSIVLPRGLSWRNPGFSQTERDPVVCVSFEDATRYAQWLSRKTGKAYGLPSEAQWEYAARAGTTGPRYWTGEDSRACDFANVFDLTAAKVRGPADGEEEGGGLFKCRDRYVYTAPVGSFRPNAFGLYDMLGNVWQWTADCYTDNYADVPDRSNDQETRQDCSTRVLRGGSWMSSRSETRSAYRHGEAPDYRDIVNGFRVVRTD